MRALLSYFSFFISVLAFSAQPHAKSQILRGKVVGVKSQVVFATVGIINENIGTITNENGRFEIEIPNVHLNKALTVSHIGYETLKLKIDSLSKCDHVIIKLREKVYLLEEVVLTSKKPRIKEYGNKTACKTFLSIQEGVTGTEIVMLIKPKHDIYLNSVSVNLLNQLEREFTLLLNIYSVNGKTQLPDLQLLKEQRIIRSTLKKGWLEVDLNKDDIILKNPFYVGFQWVGFDKSNLLIGICNNSPLKSLYRSKPLGTWENLFKWNIKVKGTLLKNP